MCLMGCSTSPAFRRGFTGGRVELGLLARVGRDLERLLQETHRLEERTERPGTFRCARGEPPVACAATAAPSGPSGCALYAAT